jgi:hypothetical protein
MSDRYATEATTRPAPNPHDTAMAVFRPDLYTEAIDWLTEMHPDNFAYNAGFRHAVRKLQARQAEVAAVPGAGQLDHATAAYARLFRDKLLQEGYAGAAKLLDHLADDYDGGHDQ